MKARIALIAGAAGLLLLPLGPGGAVQAPVDAVAAEIADQQRALVEARRQSADAAAEARRVSAQAAAMQDHVERDRTELAALALSIQSAEAELAASRARSLILAGLERQQRDRLTAQQRPVAELMATLQLMTRRPPLSLFAQPGSARDMVHTRAMIEAVLPEMRRRTAGLNLALERSRALAAQRRAAEGELAAGARRLVDRRAALARGEAERRIRAAALAGSAGLEGDRALALGERAENIGVLLGELEASATVRDRLASLAGPRPRPGSVNRDSRVQQGRQGAATAPAAYRLPVVGRVVQGFGEVTPDGSRSRGVTIAAAPGAQVVAPARGRIAYAGAFRGYGRIVIIDHGGGWTSLVTDMIALSAGVGDRVEQGTPLGRTGPERPRVTVELRRGGQPIDFAALTV